MRGKAPSPVERVDHELLGTYDDDSGDRQVLVTFGRNIVAKSRCHT